MSEENTPADPEGTDGERKELPTWNRGKSKRKARAEEAAVAEVAEGDVFTRGMADAGRAVVSQGRLLAIAVAVVLAVVGGVVYFLQSTTQATAESTRELSDLVAVSSRARPGTQEDKDGKNPPADPVYVDDADRKQQFEEALASAKAVDDAEVQALAGLVEAASLFQAGDHDGALAMYEDFLARHTADHPMYFVAREGRALAKEAKGDLEGALAEFEKMTAAENAERFYADMALWHQGRLLERLERPADALAVYKRYQELYPETTRPSVASEKVRARLAELDVPGEAAPAPTGGDAE